MNIGSDHLYRSVVHVGNVGKEAHVVSIPYELRQGGVERVSAIVHGVAPRGTHIGTSNDIRAQRGRR